MKNIFQLPVYAFLAFAVLLVSCKKEQDPLSILTSKTWKYSTIDRTPDSKFNSIFNSIYDCEKDDTFRFTNDGKLITYNNVKKCVANEPTSKLATYSYSEETKKLIIDGYECEVVSLTADQLKYRIPFFANLSWIYVVIILE